ncbi:hypothetical protein KFK09_014942 [Dendrobium nobile]|uniref:Ubiquitin-like protease family profile domain-containing protein n=1 Tax=Dendrobium nobile TaxID=94219 RepID=A0A8T3B4R0_DENNO|nr:hypothetical protein KFK09_014942 [Dendrobium nobile]
MLNKIQENLGARLDRVEDIVEKLQADQDSLKYKFIEFQMNCDHNPEKPHISSSSSSFQSVKNTALYPSEQPKEDAPPPPPLAKELLPQPPIQDVPPPPPLAKELPPQPPIQDVPPPPPLAKELLPQPPIQDVPPPPPSAKEDVPLPKDSSSKHMIQKIKREDDEKAESSSKQIILYVKKKNKEIKYLHEDTIGCFSSDITKWNVQAVRGIPTQSNDYDCGMFVCKYMEKAEQRKKIDWNAFKD